jgi:hypothetical protein
VTAPGRQDRAGRDETDTVAPDPLRDIAELLNGETPRSRTFLGGLVAGALVGAAIAGSTIWRSARSRRGKTRNAA